MKIAAFSALWLALGLTPLAHAQDARDEGFEPPRYQLAVMAGGSVFRGGSPAGLLASALRFQPDVTSTTVAGTLSLRLARHVYVDADVAGALSRRHAGLASPDNVIIGGGLRVPVYLSRRRFVPYVALGGGLVNRRVQDSVEAKVEEAFAVRATDPQAYAGVGVEFRLKRAFGLRAEYRYVRIFPENIDALALQRDSYATHRALAGLAFSR